MNQKGLKEILNYSPETGIFTWKKKICRKNVIGAIAGCNKEGYIIIAIRGRRIYAHRLAFLYMTGRVPKFVDHKNLNRSDNSWKNLRASSMAINSMNRDKMNRGQSKYKGVMPRNKKWVAKIFYKRPVWLGTFTTEKSAAYAYDIAAKKYFGEFARLNFP